MSPCRMFAVGTQSMRLTRHAPATPLRPANWMRAVTP